MICGEEMKVYSEVEGWYGGVTAVVVPGYEEGLL